MDRKLVGAMLLLARSGCRMCSSCCDNLPPVLDGPHPYTGGRAGSAFGGVEDAGGVVNVEPLYQGEITDPPAEEESTATDP